VLPGGRNIGGQATQAVYQIMVMEEYDKLNDLTSTLLWLQTSLPRWLASD
jgi:hypothetical protein